jgi:hypothetical protein
LFSRSIKGRDIHHGHNARLRFFLHHFDTAIFTLLVNAELLDD